MIEYFNGVLQRMNIAMRVSAIGCALAFFICGIWLATSEDEEERARVSQYCKVLLMAIAIEVSAIIWLPAHL